MENQGSNRSRCTSALRLTLKAWLVITVATIGLCYLTQLVASWFGIKLNDQANIAIVMRYAGWNKTFILLCSQIVLLMPAFEELVFRYLLFHLPRKFIPRRAFLISAATISSLLFSAAHYFVQPFPDNAFLALFFFGLAQCWLYAKTRRLWCAILNHSLFNLTNLILLFLLIES